MPRFITTSGVALAGVLLLGGCSAPDDTGPDSGPTRGPTGTTGSDRPTLEPGPAGCPRIGVYSDWSPDSDRQVMRQFGALPEIASSYYQPSDSIRLAEETARIRRGTSPNITITTKGTAILEALAAGRSHPGFADAKAWLDRYLAGLSTLADVDPDVPVYATIDHEFRVKARTGQVTGPSALPEVYGRALDRFFAAAAKANPRIRTTYWMVGYDRDFEGTVGEQFRTSPDAVVFDPYPNEAGETLPVIAFEDVEWIRSQDWYDGQELGIGEFGVPVEFGDEAMAEFLTDLPQQLSELGVSWAVLFNRERDFDTRIAARADGQEYPLAQAAFAASLKESRAC